MLVRLSFHASKKSFRNFIFKMRRFYLAILAKNHKLLCKQKFWRKIHFTLRIGVFTLYKTTSPQKLFPSDYIILYTIYCLHRTCMLQLNMACFFLVHTLDKMTPPVYSGVHWTLYARYLKITAMFNWSPCSRPPGLFMLGLKMPKSTILLHYESRKNANANASHLNIF